MFTTVKDLFAGKTEGIDFFNFEDFFESETINSEDAFKYEDTLLRPRHIAQLAILFAAHSEEDEKILFRQTGPIAVLDGIQYATKTYSCDSFAELYEALDDYLENNEVPVLYKVYRVRAIDGNTFEPKIGFKLRLGEPMA